MTPAEAARCIGEAAAPIGDTLAAITIGQWLSVLGIIFMVPGVLASVVLVFVFVKMAYRRVALRHTFTATTEGTKRRHFWIMYLMAAGFAGCFIQTTEKGVIIAGLCLILMAAGLVIAGPSWWGVEHNAQGQYV